MTYKLDLHTRRRLAADKRRRYWQNPEERLRCINAARRYRGLPAVTSLDEVLSCAERGRIGIKARLG